MFFQGDQRTEMPFSVHNDRINEVVTKGIEPFVDGDRAAEFLCVTRRRVLQMARNREIPAHPIGRGKRKIWRFRLNEIAQAMTGNKTAAVKSGSPR